MKKTLWIIVSSFIIISLSACNSTTPPSSNPPLDNNSSLIEESVSSIPDVATEFQQQFLKEIAVNIECLNSCVKENFLAERTASSTEETELFAIYKSESDFTNSWKNVAKLVPNEELDKITDYYIDPTYSGFFEVKNFKTNIEVRENLRKYLSDDVINKWFKDDFLEFEGALYLVRGARGYGAVSIDLDSAEYIEEKNGKHYVSVNFKIFEGFYNKEILEFIDINGRWIITDEIVVG